MVHANFIVLNAEAEIVAPGKHVSPKSKRSRVGARRHARAHELHMRTKSGPLVLLRARCKQNADPNKLVSCFIHCGS